MRKRVQLLKPDDRDIVDAAGPAHFVKIVEYFAAANHQLARCFRIGSGGVVKYDLKTAVGQLFETASAFPAPQQALRRHNHQWFAQWVEHLLAQHMENLGGVGGQTDLNIVFGAKLQKALEPGRRMFRTLPFVTVRQQHRQSAKSRCHLYSPLVMNWSMTTWAEFGEIAELRLPDHERVRRRGGVAVLESEHPPFRTTASRKW